MRQARELAHEEILKELRRIDEIDSCDSEISIFDGDEEYVPTESNNSDDESEISLQHDGECHENSKYVLNGFPYTVADSERPTDQAVHEHVVMKLTWPYFGKGRNVTTDSYFNTVQLCERLKSSQQVWLEHLQEIVKRSHKHRN
ncbi:hypothetical protein AVEN_117344-1 [Araneus ventricosus]|uniref:PiggyBac transposable element-derived protein domain-containing protein n=1 Tax=Araneus ventricosus TaxID=182803 RepID=A0A4Y2HYK7_ARAVE|nr:hypothetical protein AVEN_117344-1 [Araneus ventricosus]